MLKPQDLSAPFQKGAYHYSFEDGLTDLALGLFLLLYAGALRVGSVSPVLVLLLLAFGIVPALRALQRRITHPRIGYAEPVQEKPTILIRGMATYAAIVTVALFAGLRILAGRFDSGIIYQSTPALAAVLMAGGFHYVTVRTGLRRFQFLNIVSLAGGLFFSVLRFEGRLGNLAAFLLCLGALFMVTGLVVLLRFLHNNPLRPEEASDARR